MRAVRLASWYLGMTGIRVVAHVLWEHSAHQLFQCQRVDIGGVQLIVSAAAQPVLKLSERELSFYQASIWSFNQQPVTMNTRTRQTKKKAQQLKS